MEVPRLVCVLMETRSLQLAPGLLLGGSAYVFGFPGLLVLCT